MSDSPRELLGERCYSQPNDRLSTASIQVRNMAHWMSDSPRGMLGGRYSYSQLVDTRGLERGCLYIVQVAEYHIDAPEFLGTNSRMKNGVLNE